MVHVPFPLASRRKPAAAACPCVAGYKPQSIALALAACFGLDPAAFAQPVGAQAIHGTATLSPNGSRLTVTTQNGPGTSHSVINWQSFNIGPGNTTQFIQQSASSMVYNRVTSDTLSSITGSMTPNGKVFAVDPNSAKPAGVTATDIAASASVPSNAFQIITSDGAHTFRSLPPPPNAATQMVIGADGVVRLTSTKP